MAARRSERMGVVLMVAERHEQEAAGYLSRHSELVRNETEQLTQLAEYRDTYLGHYASDQARMGPAELSRYSQFLLHLGGAIDDQQRKLATLQQQLETVRRHWHEQHQRRKAVEDLIARLRRGEDRDAEKQLQKQLDEMASASRRHKPSGVG